ncbi:MAG: M23 family metallopeptidase [Bacteroidia bacterium]
MMNRSIVSGIIALVFSFCLNAQNDNFLWPLESKYVPSGNYGELRPNHFHAGLDFGTHGRYNAPVYATMKGYVSRIKVSDGGYGRAIYLTHPNGKVTLYAHLNKYMPKVEKFILEEQLKKKSFEVEIYPEPGTFTVNAGDVIAYSGNSGSSTAPHLHYEIRDEKTEVPLNPALYYKIDDKIAPVVNYMAIYNLSDTTSPRVITYYKLIKSGNDYKLKDDSITVNNSIIAFGVSGFDKMFANGGVNNIYSVEMYYDDIFFYKHVLDNVPFNDTRYVNEFSEIYEKKKFQRLFIPTLYPEGMYKRVGNKGRIFLMDGKYHQIKMKFLDESGNECSLSFYIKATKKNYFEKPIINGDAFADCRQDFMYGRKGLQIFIPANTLYNSTPVIFENTLNTSGKLLILPFSANLRSTAIVGFEIPKKFKPFKHSLVFKSNESLFLPIVKGDSVFYSVKSFGAFLLDVDTIAPKIQCEVNGSKLKSKYLKRITFKIYDNLSGLDNYNLYLNGEWVLASYDTKSRRLSYDFDSSIKKGKNEFKVVCTDYCKNKSEEIIYYTKY